MKLPLCQAPGWARRKRPQVDAAERSASSTLRGVSIGWRLGSLKGLSPLLLPGFPVTLMKPKFENP